MVASAIRQNATTGAPVRSEPKLGNACAWRPSVNAATDSSSAAVTTPWPPRPWMRTSSTERFTMTCSPTHRHRSRSPVPSSEDPPHTPGPAQHPPSPHHRITAGGPRKLGLKTPVCKLPMRLRVTDGLSAFVVDQPSELALENAFELAHGAPARLDHRARVVCDGDRTVPGRSGFDHAAAIRPAAVRGDFVAEVDFQAGDPFGETRQPGLEFALEASNHLVTAVHVLVCADLDLHVIPFEGRSTNRRLRHLVTVPAQAPSSLGPLVTGPPAGRPRSSFPLNEPNTRWPGCSGSPRNGLPPSCPDMRTLFLLRVTEGPVRSGSAGRSLDT